MTPILSITIQDKNWKKIPRLAYHCNRAVAATLEHLPAKLQHGYSFSILLADDKTLCALNKKFRKINKPTNVLSFPQMTRRQIMKSTQKVIEIGDIALSYQTLKREAMRDGKSFENHLVHLVIHGMLHLLGYDHHNDRAAAIMEKLEITIMHKLKRPNPYILTKAL